jgi:ABC-type transport system involved in cytochrome bd biosynthesis fused ATPase/permease subunit
MSDNEYIERQDAPEINKGAAAKKPTSKKVKASAFTQILNGEFLTRDFVLDNLNYIFFIFLLLILLVSKGYYGKQVLTEINENQQLLDQNTAEYIEAKTDLEILTRRFKLVEKLQKRNLVESQKATKIIRLKKNKK